MKKAEKMKEKKRVKGKMTKNPKKTAGKPAKKAKPEKRKPAVKSAEERKGKKAKALAEVQEPERVFVKGDVIERFDLPLLVKEHVETLVKEHSLSKKEEEELLKKLRSTYALLKVESGEAVGIVTAQSLGEPGTQLTLRTKHYAGAAEVSVGSGIQRVEEIVDGRSKARYPTMTIYIEDENLKKDFDKCDAFAKSLIDVRLLDVVSVREELGKGKVSIEMLKEEARERNIKLDDLAEKIEKQLKAKGKRKENVLEFNFKNESFLKIRRNINKMLNTRIQGIRGIEKTIVSKDGNEYVVRTRGTNLKAVIKLPEIDGTRTTTNDINEISKVLGIEAGRISIVRELSRVLKENNIAIDVRHIMLLADLMTFDGSIRGIVRTGITREKSSPFARAAFEETVKHLLDAAFAGQLETLDGVVENIIVGQPIKVGTGLVNLVMKSGKK
ncbi:MAG: DNA-directed RNA polymerase subunit A'' [Candidatus Diapherotrites archaeon]|uniref:DNA-directed RNA polymerase n=1 Tax=Candidatus Iainarchaeum sp. TaxID=3101447 RepID=A0A7J4IS81_9ARCH|nr:MAG: DNA-directed RNA polymerase subunit A' [archaeon GW2011_AR10]MBS3059564.1 DNA-directed RNA polymerase subunit A'' [Candidatus Diapherotrites archaeon]HIH08312.1 DNA-directed RNA polymerase subunit A'' [Candidatus Diapherotrites archaeon]